MSGDMSRVAECGKNLSDGELILLRYGGNGFTGREGADDGGNVDARPDKARLAESDVGIHRDAWKHFHVRYLASTLAHERRAAERLGIRTLTG